MCRTGPWVNGCEDGVRKRSSRVQVTQPRVIRRPPLGEAGPGPRRPILADDVALANRDGPSGDLPSEETT